MVADKAAISETGIYGSGGDEGEESVRGEEGVAERGEAAKAFGKRAVVSRRSDEWHRKQWTRRSREDKRRLQID